MKLCILGLHPSGQVPEGYEVWTLNEGWQLYPDYDRLWELHRPEWRPWRTEEHWKHVEENQDRLVTFHLDLWPAASTPWVSFGKRWYFTNTVAWMLAEVLRGEADYDVVRLEGLHFETLHERMMERACVEYWLGMLEGKGVTVEIPPASPLLHGDVLYGLQDTFQAHRRLYSEMARYWWHEEMTDYERYLQTGRWQEHEPTEEASFTFTEETDTVSTAEPDV